MRAWTSNHPSHLIRKCHWIERELGQVWKRATQALYLDGFLMVFLWSVLISDKLWPRFSVDFCDLDDKVWQRPADGSFELFRRLPPQDLCPFQVLFPVILSLYFGRMSPHLGTGRVTATLIALRSPQDSCLTWLLRMTPDYKKISFFGKRWQPGFCLLVFEITLPPVFLRTSPDRVHCTLTPADATIHHA